MPHTMRLLKSKKPSQIKAELTLKTIGLSPPNLSNEPSSKVFYDMPFHCQLESVTSSAHGSILQRKNDTEVIKSANQTVVVQQSAVKRPRYRYQPDLKIQESPLFKVSTRNMTQSINNNSPVRDKEAENSQVRFKNRREDKDQTLKRLVQNVALKYH